MIQFTQKNEANVKERINAIFTLFATTLFCISELVNISDDFTLLILKIIGAILFFWFILGKILSKILFLLLKEIVEDQVEIEEDMNRRKELHDIEELEKRDVRDNIQKVKF